MKLKAIKISENVYWVGAVDWAVRNFHGYTTSRGTTYNAYLIIDEKITLIDTVKKGFEDELLDRVASVIDPQKIDYIISNHSEPDHSGTLKEVIRATKPERVFASKMGVKALKAHYDLGIDLEAVTDGQELSLGKKTIQFFETRMLHWPDSMFSYIKEDKILFSQDAFGMHLASTERFDNELDWNLLENQAQDYYANIITLYSPHVKRLIEKIKKAGLEFSLIAPDHGPVWTNQDNIKKIISLYEDWSNRKLKKKVVIIYDTMWNSTKTMARFIEDGVKDEGVDVRVMPLAANDRSQVAHAVFDASALIVGAPTLNNQVYPSLMDVLTYLKGLKMKTPITACFGSYGWSGEAVKQLSEVLVGMESEVIGSVRTQYVPGDEIKKQCFELGKLVANKVKEKEKL